MKSLSDILHREEKIIDEIYTIDGRAERVRKQLDSVKESPFDCRAKEIDIEKYEAELRELSIRVAAANDILDSIHDELRDYIRELMFGPTQNTQSNNNGVVPL